MVSCAIVWVANDLKIAKPVGKLTFHRDKKLPQTLLIISYDRKHEFSLELDNTSIPETLFWHFTTRH